LVFGVAPALTDKKILNKPDTDIQNAAIAAGLSFPLLLSLKIPSAENMAKGGQNLSEDQSVSTAAAQKSVNMATPPLDNLPGREDILKIPLIPHRESVLAKTFPRYSSLETETIPAPALKPVKVAGESGIAEIEQSTANDKILINQKKINQCPEIKNQSESFENTVIFKADNNKAYIKPLENIAKEYTPVLSKSNLPFVPGIKMAGIKSKDTEKTLPLKTVQKDKQAFEIQSEKPVTRGKSGFLPVTAEGAEEVKNVVSQIEKGVRELEKTLAAVGVSEQKPEKPAAMLRIKLKPEGLGEVFIELKNREKNLVVTIKTLRTESKSLIAESAGLLIEKLGGIPKAGGFNSVTVNINTSSNINVNIKQDTPGYSGESQTNGRIVFNNDIPKEKAKTSLAALPVRFNSGKIDCRI